MLLNIFPRYSMAYRTAVRMMQQPARYRVSRFRKFDGLLRRCYTTSTENERRMQSDMPRKPCGIEPEVKQTVSRCPTPGASGSTSNSGSESAGGTGADSNSTGGMARNIFILLAATGAAIGAYAAYANSGVGSSSSTAGKSDAGSKSKSRADSNGRVPANSADIPKHVPYLLIGGGTASFAAFRAIKSANPKAKVLVVTDETEMPYMRPPLSKEMWLSATAPTEETVPKSTSSSDNFNFKQWNGKERSLFFEPADFYLDPAKLSDSANGGVAIVRGYSVRHIDVCTRTAVLSDGTEIKYDECLLATGSQPRNLDVFAAAPIAVKERVTLFKTVSDFEKLRDAIGKSKTVAVIGGGFLGSELACALAQYSRKNKTPIEVYQVFREKGNMGRVLPRYLSEWTANRVRDEGVNVIPGTQVESVRMQDNQVRVTLMNGRDLLVDRVVVAIGSEPDIALAQSSGLEVDHSLGGYVVNAELEARRHLYVAGDAACFYDTKLGRRRVEHHDHAVVSGRLAGENMVGQKKPYKHQSMFWSDIGSKVGFEAIGIIDASLPTVGVFAKASSKDTPAGSSSNNLSTDAKATTPADSAGVLMDAQHKISSKSRVVEPTGCKCTNDESADSGALGAEEAERYGKGVVFYLRDDKVVGIVLWNVFNRINTARAVVNENKHWEDLNELAKLFEIHT